MAGLGAVEISQISHQEGCKIVPERWIMQK